MPEWGHCNLSQTIWGDGGTLGNVLWDGEGYAEPSPAEFAGTTAKIRDEVRAEK
ncbi:hypothetical protein [Streptomyces meridianus]|uniref:Uncharacterized protein n=1 Tax=Streptomyces meridianus TaxID=2938945 RepID=A0ABT0XC84_9ACTN|nr:hypothetical protein [Streptomyces meridianus]MCM2580126.1 hypothetical protein [Streptomyces meridianus]